MMSLVPVTRKGVSKLKERKDSLGKASEAFITSLESDFPATIYTLCRISTKITSSEDSPSELCTLCHSKNDVKNVPHDSAQSALQISHQLSASLTPPSNHNLCYTCHNIFKESNSTLIHDLHALKRNQKDQIREFLLEDEDEQ